MTEVLVERRWDEPLSDAAIRRMSEGASDCLGLHRVSRCWSLLSADGHESFCHFTAPDAESVRIALRLTSKPQGLAWVGTVHDAIGVTTEDRVAANFLVSRVFAVPTAFEHVGMLHADLCRRHGVLRLRAIQSADGRRVVDLYRAPDDRSMRAALHAGGLVFDRVLAVRRPAA